METVSLKTIYGALASTQFPPCELVVGIAEGGVVPATLIAHKLRCDLSIVRINYRDAANVPQYARPKLLSNARVPRNVKRILLVDDVAITGKTLEAAKRLFGRRKVTTVVLRGQADYVLLPELASCVKWPWTPKNEQ
ncbi:MAG: phosphoribosyltransferase [Candidatus Omnitrophota bacterium]